MIFLIFLLPLLAYCSTLKQIISEEPSVAVFTQKLLQFNITIDKLPLLGLNISTILDKYGYTNSSLTRLTNIIANENINTLLIEVYWNDHVENWQCNPNNQSIILLEEVLESMKYNYSYIPNLTQLIFNVHLLKDSKTPTKSISSILRKTFDHSLYTPTDFEDSFPTFYEFIYIKQKTIIPMIWQNNDLDTSNENSTFVLNSTKNFSMNITNALPDPVSKDQFVELETMSWKTYLTNTSSIDDLKTSMMNGYTSIISNKNFNLTLLDQLAWSWNISQPTNDKLTKQLIQTDRYIFNDENSPNPFNIYKCAVVLNQSWYVENCYMSHYVACKSKHDDYSWYVPRAKSNYFEANDVCAAIDNEKLYNFSIPKTALLQKYLVEFLKKEEINEPVWIDFNSIETDDCWIPGGPNSVCPYTNVNAKKKYVTTITPISIFILFFISTILFTSSQKIPVQKNRKYWKKLVSDFTKDEYEGVPA